MICLGIDIGTTTLRASALDVRVGPHQREWKAIGAALCQLTPFIDANLDVEAIARALENWRVAQTLPEPDVGTILVTGEAQRAPNAVEAAEALRLRWPALLSAQLDPELETAVAAHGSGAVEFSRNSPGQSVLHLDIGGGTTNCAWLENGEIRDTACLDLGARKWVCDPENGQILHRTQAAVFLEKTLGRVNDFTLATAPRIAGSSRQADVTAALAGGTFGIAVEDDTLR